MTDRDLADLAREHPDWSLWRSRTEGGLPGDYYATRRKATARLPEGAARTLAAPTLTDLACHLLAQAQIKEAGE